MTNRLLLEAGWTYVNFNYSTSLQPGASLNTPYSYRELSTGYVWGNYQQDPTGNAPGTQAEFMGPGANATHQYNVNVAASYVTGSHAAKFGLRLMQSEAYADRLVTGDGVTLQLRNGAPTQLTQYATPIQFNEKLKANLGVFAQDQWTIKRLTVNAGLRLRLPQCVHPGADAAGRAAGPAAQFPGDRQRAELEGRVAAARRLVRPVRQRQDRRQGQRRTLSRRRRAAAVHARGRSGDQRRRDGDADLERRQPRLGAAVHVHQSADQRRVRPAVRSGIWRQPNPDAL